MNHAFLHCSKHSPWRRVAIVCPVWPHCVMLTKPYPLAIIVTAAQRKLQMTRHSGCTEFSFAALVKTVFELFITRESK